MTSDTLTPRCDKERERTVNGWEIAEQLEVELAVALSRLYLWRRHAFDANSSDEFVEIDGLIGELKAMRREFEESGK